MNICCLESPLWSACLCTSHSTKLVFGWMLCKQSTDATARCNHIIWTARIHCSWQTAWVLLSFLARESGLCGKTQRHEKELCCLVDLQQWMLVGESAGRQKHSVYLYRFLGMIGTSLTAHLGSNPAVKKAMPNSLAMVLICKAMHAVSLLICFSTPFNLLQYHFEFVAVPLLICRSTTFNLLQFFCAANWISKATEHTAA